LSRAVETEGAELRGHVAELSQEGGVLCGVAQLHVGIKAIVKRLVGYGSRVQTGQVHAVASEDLEDPSQPARTVFGHESK
jgi:hypothetical protein